MEDTATHPPLVLIHGAWLSSGSWENFADYFRGRGYAVSAPEWPRKHGDVEEIRESADEVEGLGLDEIVDHYESLIRELDEPPVLIGHSYGGLIVELLLDRGLGRAGVAMSPASSGRCTTCSTRTRGALARPGSPDVRRAARARPRMVRPRAGRPTSTPRGSRRTS